MSSELHIWLNDDLPNTLPFLQSLVYAYEVSRVGVCFTVEKQDFAFRNIEIYSPFAGLHIKSSHIFLEFQSVMRTLIHQSIICKQHILAVYLFW